MKKKRKICIMVASRANYGRIKSVLKAVQEHPELELQLIVGASALLYRFGQVIDIIKADGFDVSATVYCIVEGENPTTMAKSTGMAIMELATLFENLKPDVVLTVADRFETMATAIAASYMNIPLVHTQGGEKTGSIDESVRHAITKLAHVHFPATELAAERIIKMGENPSNVYVTGCPAIDAIASLDLSLPDKFFEGYGGTGRDIDQSKSYLVVLQHPVTTEYGSGLSQINETLAAIKKCNMQTIFLWPNVDAGSDAISKGLRMFREHNGALPIHFYRNFSVEDYARLIYNCFCLIGNSSSAIREGAFLGVPAVNIGTRQLGRERAENVIDVAYDREEIHQAIMRQLNRGKYKPSTLYGDGKAGERIADILAGHTFSIIQKSLTY
jgi:UDP-hydrolysing UDP-N-acetyl-D-glucosamine 2-epimerase